MSALFGRQAILQIGPSGGDARTITGLRMAARVAYKSVRAGEMELEVYNPAPQTIAAAQQRGVITRLLAGYQVPESVFDGSPIRHGVRVRHEGVDRILSITARTGGVELERARVALAYSTPTRASQVIAACLDALGLPRGTVVLGADYELPGGISYSGPAWELLRRTVQGAGASVCVRDGAVQILPRERDTGEEVPRITPETGLIGSPVRRTGKDRALIEVRALLIPGLRPGKRFVLESDAFSGVYKARDVAFELDTDGGEWTVTATGRELPDARRARR